jgi:hypothetical protein
MMLPKTGLAPIRPVRPLGVNYLILSLLDQQSDSTYLICG